MKRSSTSKKEMVILELGVGKRRRFDNSIAFDIVKTPVVDKVWDLRKSIPLIDNYADMVYCEHFIEHVPFKKIMQEIHRVLKEDGLLILSTPHKGLFGFLDYLNFRMYKLAGRIVKGEEYYDSFLKPKHRHYSLNSIEELLHGKFKINNVFRSGLLVEPVCNIILELERLFHIPILSGLIRKIAETDYRREYGAWSFNIMIKANKI